MPSALGPFSEFRRGTTLYVAILVPALLAACTSLREKSPGSSSEPLDIEGLWIVRGFPCGGRDQDLQLSLRQRRKLLDATCVAQSECAPVGALLWKGELPAEVIGSDDLPLTVQVELALPVMRTASVTLLSADNIVLLVDKTTIKLERGTLEAAPAPAAMGGRGGGSSPPDTSTLPPSSGDSSGAMSGAGGVAGTAGQAGRAAAAGSGPAGASAPSSAGSGTSNSTAGTSGNPSLAGRSGGAAGRGATPAGGSSGAAGSGRSSAAGSGGAGWAPAPDITGLRWDCSNILGYCVCITVPESQTVVTECRTKLPCCDTDGQDQEPDCICEAEQLGGGCPVGTANRPLVAWCPGSSR